MENVLNSILGFGNLLPRLYRDEAVWVAHEVEAVLGLENRERKLLDLIMSEWKDDFIEEKDYVRLAGVELTDFKATFKGDRSRLPPSSGQLLLLKESGLWMVFIKTPKLCGVQLRRLIVGAVFPYLKHSVFKNSA
jgi:hypothetical protein